MTSLRFFTLALLVTLVLTPARAGEKTPDFPELKQDAAGYWQVGFQHLASFSFGHHKVADADTALLNRGARVALLVPDDSDQVELPTEPGQSGTIPDNVRALDGRRVCITGYMLPVKVENGLVKECLLLRNQMMCCYGRRPELNEWVTVRFAGAGVPSRMDTPVAFYGTLHVGEQFADRVFLGLYELSADKISAP